MNLKIKTDTVGYNNKILVSDANFGLRKNDEVNLMTPAIKNHKTNSLETSAMKSTQTAARPKHHSNDVLSHAPPISQKNQEPKTITRNDEKFALVSMEYFSIKCMGHLLIITLTTCQLV